MHVMHYILSERDMVIIFSVYLRIRLSRSYKMLLLRMIDSIMGYVPIY